MSNGKTEHEPPRRIATALERISDIFHLAAGTAAGYALLTICRPNDNVFLQRNSFALALLFAGLVLFYGRYTHWQREDKTRDLEEQLHQRDAKIKQLEEQLQNKQGEVDEVHLTLEEVKLYDPRESVNHLMAELVEDAAPDQEVVVPRPNIFLVMFDPTAGDKTDPFIVPVCDDLPDEPLRHRAGPEGELVVCLETQTIVLPDGGGTEKVLVAALVNRGDGTEVRLPHGFIGGDVHDIGPNLCVLVSDYFWGAVNDTVCLSQDDYRDHYLAIQRENVAAVREEHIRGLVQKDDNDSDASPEGEPPIVEAPPSAPIPA